MADNYLERKMEELRSGRKSGGGRPVQGATAREGALGWRLPRVRVAVLAEGDGYGTAAAVAVALSAHGARVALVADAGCVTLPAGGAVRCIETEDWNEEGMERVFGNLAGAWLDVDMAVGTSRLATDLFCRAWTRHKILKPIPCDYRPRVVELLRECPDTVHDTGAMTCNAVVEDGGQPELVARTVLWLALPWNGNLDGSVINLNNKK